MGRRRGGGPPVSLFSFQDIITSVTGIMILVTLLMAVELIRRPQNMAKAAASVDSTELDTIAAARQKLEALRLQQRDIAGQLTQIGETAANAKAVDSAEPRKAIARLREEMAALERQPHATLSLDELRDRQRQLSSALERVKKQNRVVYNPVIGAAKQAWLVEISGEKLVVAKAGTEEKPLLFTGTSGLQQFTDWSRLHDRRQEYFVLLIKPSGISSYLRVQKALKEERFDLGFDVLSEEQMAIDSISGASLP